MKIDLKSEKYYSNIHHTEGNRTMVILEFYWEEKGNLQVRDIFYCCILDKLSDKRLVKDSPLVVYLNSNSECNWEELG